MKVSKSYQFKELEEKMLAEAETKRAQWLEKNGFNENKETYVYFQRDSYNVKDQLKDAGFHFSSFLLWHAPQVPEGYEDKVIKVHFNEVCCFSAWGDGHYIKDARSKIEGAIKQAQPPILSEWIGNIGDRIKELPVILTLVRGFEGQWGYSQLVRFEDERGNVLKWFTSVDLSDYSVGDQIQLTATIKDHIEDKYEDNAHVTIITRAKLKVA